MRHRAQPVVRALLLAAAGVLALGASGASAQAQLAPSLSVDTAFAPPDGIARDGTTGATDIPGDVAVDGERIYTVGELNGNVGIVARRTNGTYDTGFAGDGILEVVLGPGRDVGMGIVVLPDRRLRVLASTDTDATSANNLDVALIGLNADGTDDMAFGDGDGRVIFPVGAAEDTPSGIAADAAGRLAIVGWRRDASSKEDTFLSLRAPDGAPAAGMTGDGVTAFNASGTRIFDRAGSSMNDRGVDVAFRPGGGVVALLQVATSPDVAVNNFVAVMHAFGETGADDFGFSEDGDLILAVGEPNTIPGGLVVYGGRLWVTGSTKVGVDTDAFLARVDVAGGGLQFRRFDMRGGRIPPEEAVVSGGADLAVLPGSPDTLVVVGSITYQGRPFWAAASFNGLGGNLAQAGYGDVLIPTDEYGALVGVAAGRGFLAAAGSLVNVNGNFDTSFGTTRLLVDANKRCDLSVEVLEPLEVEFQGDRPAAVKVRVTNAGTKTCAGRISAVAPYSLRVGAASGEIATGTLAPGASYATGGAVLTYAGPRLREDTLTVVVRAAGDANLENDSSLVRVVFSYCDLGLRSVGSAGMAPTEGSRRFELSLRNVGTVPCRRARVTTDGGASVRRSTESFTLAAGRSASEEISVAVGAPRRIGERVRMGFRARADADVDPGNDRAAVSPLIVGVGDTNARGPSPRARLLSGRARGGRGPVKRRSLRVKSVHIAVRRLGRGCRWLASARGRFRSGNGRGCNRPVWLKAAGTRRWSFALPRGLPRGRYVLLSRATIAAGFPEASFSARDRNRIVFRVR